MTSDVFGVSMTYLVEMSSSWSYEGSEPSQAELGHFNFRAETELNFFKNLIKNHNQISKFSTSIMIITKIQAQNWKIWLYFIIKT